MYKEPAKGQALSCVFLYNSSCGNLRNGPVNISLSFAKNQRG